jgi:uncharacterized protein YaeQ
VAQASTLYRFKLEVSDIEREFYDSLDVRVAMHPSESEPFLLTRVIAYALNYESGLEFTNGLATPDDPALKLLGQNGNIALWIDIGNPSARRLHKAAKASERVRIYTYKDPENLKREVSGESIHQAEDIEVFALDSKFIESLAKLLKRDNSWAILYNEGELVVSVGEESLVSSVSKHSLI